jgi:peptide/nickel transport system permease protein
VTFSLTSPTIRPSADGEPVLLSGPAVDPRGLARRGIRRFLGNWSFRLGAGLLLSYIVVAIISELWTPFPAKGLGVGPLTASPNSTYLFGTDTLGSDVLSKVMRATPLDLGIVAVAVAIAFVVGSVIGTIAGYVGGMLDSVIMRILEIFQAFPILLLALLIVSAVGSGTNNVVVVMALVGIPGYLRLARAELMSKRSWQFAEAARMVGCSPARVAFRHLLPNSMSPLIAYTSVNAAWTLLGTSSLGFLGVGIKPGVAEWGAMIASQQNGIINGQWWTTFFPGLAILGLAAAFYLLGDGLAEVLDPRSIR